MSSKIWRSLVAMRPAAKSPAYSASATNEQTTGIRVEWVEMGYCRQRCRHGVGKGKRRRRWSGGPFGRNGIFFARWGGRQRTRVGDQGGSWCRRWVRPAPRPGHRLRAGHAGPQRGRNTVGSLRRSGVPWLGKGCQAR